MCGGVAPILLSALSGEQCKQSTDYHLRAPLTAGSGVSVPLSLSLCVSVYLSVCVCSCVCLSIYLSVRVSVCLISLCVLRRDTSPLSPLYDNVPGGEGKNSCPIVPELGVTL